MTTDDEEPHVQPPHVRQGRQCDGCCDWRPASVQPAGGGRCNQSESAIARGSTTRVSDRNRADDDRSGPDRLMARDQRRRHGRDEPARSSSARARSQPQAARCRRARRRVRRSSTSSPTRGTRSIKARPPAASRPEPKTARPAFARLLPRLVPHCSEWHRRRTSGCPVWRRNVSTGAVSGGGKRSPTRI